MHDNRDIISFFINSTGIVPGIVSKKFVYINLKINPQRRDICKRIYLKKKWLSDNLDQRSVMQGENVMVGWLTHTWCSWSPNFTKWFIWNEMP